MNSWNLTTAIGDRRLRGELMITPLRLCMSASNRLLSAWPSNLKGSQKATEVFTRAALIFPIMAIFLATPVAAFGVLVKWADLAIRFEQLVKKQTVVGSYLPPLLEMFSRTGDRNVAYLNAKLLAEEHGFPFHFTPFKGCEHFAFSEMEYASGNANSQYFREVIYLRTSKDVQKMAAADKTRSVLYRLPFYPFTRDLAKESDRCSYPKITTDWERHKNRVRELLQVIGPYETLHIPDGVYSIALHIREGGKVDDGNTKTLHPLKVPGDPELKFYLGELQRFIESNEIPKEQPIFIHIFTDAVEPKEIFEKVQEAVIAFGGDREIQVSYTPKDQVNLLDDVANMAQFDCMIRADSNLSGPIAHASPKTRVQIFPAGFHLDDSKKEVTITEVKSIIRNEGGVRSYSYSTDYSKAVTAWMPTWALEMFYKYFGVYKTAPANRVLQETSPLISKTC